MEALVTMSSYDKGSRELAAAWLRRGNAGDARTRPVQASRRADASDIRRTGAKPESGAVFHSETQVSFSRA